MSEIQTIQANFDKNVDMKEFNFRFKKDKVGNQRSPVKLQVGVPSVEGIVAILEAGGKDLELLQDAMYDVIRGSLASYVADNEDVKQENLDLSKFTWTAIANQPREDRRSNAIPAEVWEAFFTDYAAVMPGVTGKTAEQVANACTVYQKKFALVKTNKPVIQALKTQLGLYIEHSPNAQNFEEILELLVRKAEGYLAEKDVEQLVANL